MPQRVFVTGSSGFVGSAVIDELLTRGHEPRVLIHSRQPARTDPRISGVRGGLFDTEALDEGMRDCQAVIHLVGIIAQKPGKGVTFQRIHVQGTQSIVDASVRHGVKRFVHMSALGARPEAASAYHQTKWQAEQYVRGSNLDWTIFRPSLILGPGGEFARMEAAWAKGQAPPFFFMPYFGAGLLGTAEAGRLQPMDVLDVARALVGAIEKPATIHQTYELGGPRQMTWRELHQQAAEALVGRRRPVLGVPAWLAGTVAKVLPEGWLPFNRDQVIMSQENNVCDLEPFKKDFGWEPRGALGPTFARGLIQAPWESRIPREDVLPCGQRRNELNCQPSRSRGSRPLERRCHIRRSISLRCCSCRPEASSCCC